MSENNGWQNMNRAPLNPAGKGVGPWVLLFNKHDHSVVQARWVAGELRGEWVLWIKPTYAIPQHYFTHWQPIPPPPETHTQEA